jgi:hypothetical protein
MTCRIRAGEVARPLTRLHPKGHSARSWRDRSGDPSCLGPPLLPIHFCRPVIRAAAGLGVRPDRPATAAGACRQQDLGLLTVESPRGTGDLCSFAPLTRLGGRMRISQVRQHRGATAVQEMGPRLRHLRDPLSYELRERQGCWLRHALSAPPRHARAVPGSARQTLPPDPKVQQVQDSTQHIPVRQRPAIRIAEVPLALR